MKESSEREWLHSENRTLGNPYGRLASVREKVTAQDPVLSDVSLELFNEEDNTRPEYSGAALVVTQENAPKILMALSGSEHMKYLMEMRPTAVGLMAERLGMTPGEISPELLEEFVFLHEYGHAKDFLLNYKIDENGATCPDDDAIKNWNDHYESSLLSLPIPGLDPSDLRTEVTACGGVAEFFDRYPELKTPDGHLPAEETLYRDQELAYRNLPHEKYADDFAYAFLTSQQTGVQATSH